MNKILLSLLMVSSAAFAQDEGDLLLVDKSPVEAAPVVVYSNNKFQKAVAKNDIELVMAACEEYCNVQEKFYQGNTALHVAAKNGNAELFDYLLSKGAKMTVNNAGESVMHWAAYSNSQTIIDKVLMIDKSLDVLTKDKKTPLFYAFKNKNPKVDVVSYLLKKNSNCNVTDIDGQTAMHWAMHSTLHIYYYNFYLLGCDLFVEDKSGVTPIELGYRSVTNKFDYDKLKEFYSLQHIERKK